MAFYSRKLRGAKDLEQEKESINKRLEALKADQLLPIPNFLSPDKKNPDSKTSGPQPAGVAGLLSHPLTDLAITLLKKRLAGKKNKEKIVVETTENTVKKPILLAILLEFVGGYLKWKLIELVIAGIRQLVKKHKNQDVGSSEKVKA